MQQEITEKTLLLNKKGELNKKGYAKRMNFIYNRENVKKFPLKLKEWNFYQFRNDKYIIQLTIGHVSYMTSVSGTLFDLKTGQRFEIGALKFLSQPKLDKDPEQPSFVEWANDDIYTSFRVEEKERLLCIKGKNKKYQNIEFDIHMENDPDNEKMVIATPFKNKKQFYLNYKENYYKVWGKVVFDDNIFELNDATGLIDWGRGVWPYKHEWFWGNMTSFIDGVPFGFNIGWGFGDLSNATENMFFYNKKAYKLGKLIVERNVNNYMDKWYLKDEFGQMELEFSPFYNNYTENKYVVIDTHCNQLFGYFKGHIIVDAKKIEFANLLAFIEHAENKW